MEKKLILVLLIFFTISSCSVQHKKIKETVQLCEIENPQFNYVEACNQSIKEKYSDRLCSFNLTATEFSSFGSCRNCTITCK